MVSLAAVAAVDFTSARKKGWQLQFRPRERADSYAAVGPLLAEKAAVLVDRQTRHRTPR
ncbi:hypothetical protein [Nonomuraea zeae]|uniref:hypothetical protein n=1 Tax=Nonomuraea zeae TaxID=1642303 RepID=UPI00360DAAC7